MTVVLVCDFNCVKMTVLAHCQGRPFWKKTPLQSGPQNQLDKDGEITPLIGLQKTTGKPIYKAIYRGYNSIHNYK